jgi:hypothetical protein
MEKLQSGEGLSNRVILLHKEEGQTDVISVPELRTITGTTSAAFLYFGGNGYRGQKCLNQ